MNYDEEEFVQRFCETARNQEPPPSLRTHQDLLDALESSKKLVMAPDSRDAAIDDLRAQLAEARSERDRYIARCGELEQRLAAVRQVVR